MFVAFEGIDGSGKTTVSNRVVERLRERGLSVKHLRAEGRFVSSVSEAIRSLARDARNLELGPRAEFLLYVARDVQLIEQALRPALAQHDVVIADRYLFTAEVLAHHGRGLPRQWVETVVRTVADGLWPDLTVLVDVEPALARARRKASKLLTRDQKPPSRKGLSGAGLAHLVRRGYLELVHASPERWVVVDNDQALEATVERVTELIERAARTGTASALAQFRAQARPNEGRCAEATSADAALGAFTEWLDRRAEREPHVAAYFLSGLAGPPLDERRNALAQVVPEVLLAGLAGLDDELSWELRRRLHGEHPRAVARSLSGFAGAHPRAAALRLELAPLVPTEVLASLSRLDGEEAWTLRERWIDVHPDAVMSSLGMLDTPRAWTVRERWLAANRGALGVDPELSRVACRSVTGLDDPRAWDVRTCARPAAPVAVLASLQGVTSDRAWSLRAKFLHHAPKTVMRTLRGASDARAWQLRRDVADRCKEALDGIAGVDDPIAWELREHAADRWPSTVVKSLGRLADTPRGRALLARQLATHAGNVSLLKHASAIALGMHGQELPEEA